MLEILKALGDENRLRILNLLIKNELCVCEIEVILEMTQSNVSRHLNKLKAAKIIKSSKDAQWVHYKIKESFENENKPLFDYLKHNFSLEEIFIMDMERYNSYLKSSYDCQDIRNNKDKVENEIRRIEYGK